jgi:Fe-S cluster assembly ATP-binding protein
LWSFQNLIKVFENMRETVKGTIMVISHQERILNIADEIVVIENGTVKKQGPKEEILPGLLGTSAAANIACEKLGGDR